MTGRLEGKVAAITGGASGFGETAGRLFVAEGARVVLGDIQHERGETVASSIGPNARFVPCIAPHAMATPMAAFAFVGDPDAVDEAAEAITPMSPLKGRPGLASDVANAALWLASDVANAALWLASDVANAALWLASDVANAALWLASDVANAALWLASDVANAALWLASDVANAALWLASDESGYTSGPCLTTDAGFTTGARPEAPGWAERAPMVREAGRTGL